VLARRNYADNRLPSRTLQFHPDKLPANLPIAHRQAAEAHLHKLQLAKDTLVDPVKRFAYDRFGPDILQWKHANTIRDFVRTGGRRMIPFYVGSVVGLLGAQWFGVFETSGSYVSPGTTRLQARWSHMTDTM
jgi:DnaJ-class molecular chaperone